MSCGSKQNQPIIKEGAMIKRPQMRNKLKIAASARLRYFVLTAKRLSYFDHNPVKVEKASLKGVVELSQVRIIEKMDYNAFHNHSFQVYHDNLYLYITADSEHDCTDWVTTIQQVVMHNLNLDDTFHPNTYDDGKWACCSKRSKNSIGCKTTFNAKQASSGVNNHLHINNNMPPDKLTNSEKFSMRSNSETSADYNSTTGTGTFVPSLFASSSSTLPSKMNLPLPPTPKELISSNTGRRISSPMATSSSIPSRNSLDTNMLSSATMSLSSSMSMPTGRAGEGLFEVVVLYEFAAPEEGDLEIKKGERLWVTDVSREHWWKATNSKGASGNIPSNYVQEFSLQNEDWYLPHYSRQEAEKLLSDDGRDGAFVIRASQKANMYSLSIWHHNQCRHYHIKQNDKNLYYISENYPSSTISQLILLHKYNGGGLCCRPKHAPRGVSSSVRRIIDETWDISLSELEKIKKLDEGQFGIVYFGKWRGNIEVAIKQVKENAAICEDDLLEEAEVMKHFNHPHLLRLYGIVNDNTICLITEFMSNGSLLSFLKDNTHITTNLQLMLDIATQVASAMCYLENFGFIHRDLAARNCLVGDRYLVKVADFGLTRYVIEDDYIASEGTKFPIKWAAPEVINYARFSSKSDAWSYGILLWEVFTGGSTPYKSFPSHPMMLEQILKGYRLEQPNNCPKYIYDNIMLNCWKQDPEQRVSFENIEKILQKHLKTDYSETLCINEA